MDTTIFRSLLAINPSTNFPISTNFLLSTDGVGDLLWKDVMETISTQDTYVAYLPSTIYTMSNFMYNISTGVLPGSLSTPNLTSTVNGLGNAGYLSTASLFSTVNGLGNIYTSTLVFTSTVDGLANAGYISTSQLNSTLNGLGTANYVSTLSLRSTLNGLGTAGYVSTSYLSNALSNIGATYVSTLSLTSTLNGLGTYGYPSCASLYSSISGTDSNLVSSVTNILNTKLKYYYNEVGSLILAGYDMNVTISTISSFYFYDSFFNSSITYKGNNGIITASTVTNSDFYISTLNTQLDVFSSFTHANTNLSLEIHPNIVFSQINTLSNPQIYHVSTFLTYNTSTINVLHQTKFLAMNNTASNIFQQPIRLNISGKYMSNYVYPYVLTHRFINAYSYGTNVGFNSADVNAFFDSTTSYYLSIQNIAP